MENTPTHLINSPINSHKLLHIDPLDLNPVLAAQTHSFHTDQEAGEGEREKKNKPWNKWSLNEALSMLMRFRQTHIKHIYISSGSNIEQAEWFQLQWTSLINIVNSNFAKKYGILKPTRKTDENMKLL